MNKFLMRNIQSENIIQELDTIGFDKSYKVIAANKFKYQNIKIYDLTVAQANILKQTALIYGADCAVNKDVVTGACKNTNVILCGSYSQLNKIAEHLKNQPFKLGILGNEIQNFLIQPKAKTKIIGILNITPDSFSDGNLYYEEKAAQNKLIELIQDGADIIDIGAESTRPNATQIPSEEQIKRLKPILEFVQKENLKIKLSVDTRDSTTADFALNNGVQIINDVSGFDFDNNMPKIIAKHDAEIIIQHSCGKAENTHKYENIVDEVFLSLKKKIEIANSYNIKKIIVDPGIGFSKSHTDCLKIIDNISAFYGLNKPVMLGISRKSFLNVAEEDNIVKDSLTLAYSLLLMKSGIDYLRVHNVKLHKQLQNSLPT